MLTLYILLVIENTTEMYRLRIVGGFVVIRCKDEDRRDLQKGGNCGYWLANFVGQRHTSAGLGDGYDTSSV